MKYLSRVMWTVAGLAVVGLVTPPVFAADDLRLAVHSGLFNIKQSGRAPAELGLELQLPPVEHRLIPELAQVRWVIGAAATGDDAYWAYGGLRSEIRLPERWWLGMGFAASLFEDGSGLDLGARLEFRSSIEVGRALGDRYRLGLLLHHLSNAGIVNSNPGSESLLLTLNVDLR